MKWAGNLGMLQLDEHCRLATNRPQDGFGSLVPAAPTLIQQSARKPT
jgi:hypothetical protein